MPRSWMKDPIEEDDMPNSPEHAVIAIFEDAAKADQVAHDMMAWDKANEDIKLGAIGMLTRRVARLL